MLKRTITGFFILLVTAGFIALREVSVLFFDAFVLMITLGSVIEMALASKFSNKKVEKIVMGLYPIGLALIFIFTKGESDDCLDSLMLCNEAIMWAVNNNVRRLAPFRMMTLGENTLKTENREHQRDRFTKKRRR